MDYSRNVGGTEISSERITYNYVVYWVCDFVLNLFSATSMPKFKSPAYKVSPQFTNSVVNMLKLEII